MLQPKCLGVLFAVILCIAIPAFGQDSKTDSKKTDLATTSATTSQGDLANLQEDASAIGSAATTADGSISSPKPSNRLPVLIGSLTVFALAVFVGFEVINKVPPTLHTPLMSGSNAISGITVVGAILATGFGKFGFGSLLGAAAIILAMVNVAGGFWVTHRMLSMFKKKK